jgi:hypothetical protein
MVTRYYQKSNCGRLIDDAEQQIRKVMKEIRKGTSLADTRKMADAIRKNREGWCQMIVQLEGDPRFPQDSMDLAQIYADAYLRLA